LNITYSIENILQCTITTRFNIILDKGTFDAIALNSDKSHTTSYVNAIRKLITEDDGIFVITSCNFTREELRKLFTTNGAFQYVKHVKYPTFKFGGKEGSTVATVAFRPTK